MKQLDLLASVLTDARENAVNRHVRDKIGAALAMLPGVIEEAKCSGPDSEEARWLAGGDTGTSSMTIWSVMTGLPVNRSPDAPRDPSDFGRCHRLLEKFPQWRPRLCEVADKHPSWRPLVACWDELTDLYLLELPSGRAPQLFARLQELRAQGKAKKEGKRDE